jgi:hypothetical protein
MVKRIEEMIIDDRRIKLYDLSYDEIKCLQRAFSIVAYQELQIKKLGKK